MAKIEKEQPKTFAEDLQECLERYNYKLRSISSHNFDVTLEITPIHEPIKITHGSGLW